MMKTYDRFEDELDDIRVALYEKTKHMSDREFTEHIRSESRKIAAEYGLNLTRADLSSRPVAR